MTRISLKDVLLQLITPTIFSWLSWWSLLLFRNLVHFQIYHLLVLWLFFSLKVFHISVSWWFSTGVWVTASLSNLQDSSHNSGWSRQCCSLDSLHPSRHFQVSHSSYKSFGDCTESTNYNWYNRHVHVPQFFFDSQARSRNLSLFLHSFNFTLWSAGRAKSTILQILSFLVIIIRSGGLTEIKWFTGISKSKKSLCMLFSRKDSGLCIYHLFVWSNFNFLPNCQWLTLSTQSCLVLYSFCANLRHSLIIWLIFPSLSSYNLYLLFFLSFIYSCFDMVGLMAFFCAAIRRYSVSLLSFPFLSHIHVFSCEMSLVSRLKSPGSCFSSYFCFLGIVVPLVLMSLVLFLVDVINLPARFFM